MALNDAAALSLQKLSIFVVADTTVNQNSGEFISNYNNNGSSNGWAVGNSDSVAGQLKWFSGPDGGDVLGGTTGLAVNPNTYYNINMAADPATGKTASTFDGVHTASASETTYGFGTNQIPYTGGEQVGVGFLNAFGGAQFLKGNIAEILVYNDTGLTSSQIATQTAAVNLYLDNKYFLVPEPSMLMLAALAIPVPAFRAWRRRIARSDRRK